MPTTPKLGDWSTLAQIERDDHFTTHSINQRIWSMELHLNMYGGRRLLSLTNSGPNVDIALSTATINRTTFPTVSVTQNSTTQSLRTSSRHWTYFFTNYKRRLRRPTRQRITSCFNCFRHVFFFSWDTNLTSNRYVTITVSRRRGFELNWFCFPQCVSDTSLTSPERQPRLCKSGQRVWL